MDVVSRRPTGGTFDDVRRGREGARNLYLQLEVLHGRKTGGRAIDTQGQNVFHGEDVEFCWISTYAPALEPVACSL